ncbi:tetratricopeptide repeat protein [Agaribacter marinus]|uniref:Sel1 repeat-containing protein n=1 Tax=Agaribacter marinus TaxID=1431249 RepID=A0AA37SXK3_9ALTE|nr:hypothetical protein [Agaribacter marinus]GLR71743.1 hypothetical protein GCM10007852_26510 [Agaribacter marinus]
MAILRLVYFNIFLIFTLVLSIFISTKVVADDVFKADKLFVANDYKGAALAYAEAASIGSPHAFYQLGAMNYKGLGMPVNKTKALVWFALAAEYHFSDAQNVVDNMLASLDEQTQQGILEKIQVAKQNTGKLAIEERFFPQLNVALLDETVTFGGHATLDNKYTGSDFELGVFDQPFIFDGGGFDNGGFDEFSTIFDDDITTSYLASGGLKNIDESDKLRRRLPFAIVDYDLGEDGSIRNLQTVQILGNPTTLIQRFVQTTLPPPAFQGKRVEFTNRTYLGIANFDRFGIKEQNKDFYFRVKRLARNLKKSDDLNDKFQYAMTLYNFPWLNQEEGEAKAVLAKVAAAGHPIAQYEYGLRLYRDQTNIAEAIDWLTQSSKYGYAKAQYQLARVLHASPWVMNEEDKALYWYMSAANDGHKAAALKAAELKLLAKDKRLINVSEAIALLDSIEDSQENNPEYNFLVAVSHKDRDNRDFTQVVGYMENAISLGEKYNWDVAYWEALLELWRTGRVTVKDQPS